MQPRGPLMIEHRLIERMIGLIDNEVKKIEKNNVVNHSFIDAAVDFIRTYGFRDGVKYYTIPCSSHSI